MHIVEVEIVNKRNAKTKMRTLAVAVFVLAGFMVAFALGAVRVFSTNVKPKRLGHTVNSLPSKYEVNGPLKDCMLKMETCMGSPMLKVVCILNLGKCLALNAAKCGIECIGPSTKCAMGHLLNPVELLKCYYVKHVKCVADSCRNRTKTLDDQNNKRTVNHLIQVQNTQNIINPIRKCVSQEEMTCWSSTPKNKEYTCILKTATCLGPVVEPCGATCIPTAIQCALKNILNQRERSSCYLDKLVECIKPLCGDSANVRTLEDRTLEQLPTMEANGMLSSQNMECVYEEIECWKNSVPTKKYTCILKTARCLIPIVDNCAQVCIPPTIECALKHLFATTERVKCYTVNLVACISAHCEGANPAEESQLVSVMDTTSLISECVNEEIECWNITPYVKKYTCILKTATCLIPVIEPCGGAACIPPAIECALKHVLNPSERVKCYTANLVICVKAYCSRIEHNGVRNSGSPDGLGGLQGILVSLQSGLGGQQGIQAALACLQGGLGGQVLLGCLQGALGSQDNQQNTLGTFGNQDDNQVGLGGQQGILGGSPSSHNGQSGQNIEVIQNVVACLQNALAQGSVGAQRDITQALLACIQTALASHHGHNGHFVSQLSQQMGFGNGQSGLNGFGGTQDGLTGQGGFGGSGSQQEGLGGLTKQGGLGSGIGGQGSSGCQQNPQGPGGSNSFSGPVGTTSQQNGQGVIGCLLGSLGFLGRRETVTGHQPSEEKNNGQVAPRAISPKTPTVDQCIKEESACFLKKPSLRKYTCVFSSVKCLLGAVKECGRPCLLEAIKCAIEHMLSPQEAKKCYRTDLAFCIDQHCSSGSKSTDIGVENRPSQLQAYDLPIEKCLNEKNACFSRLPVLLHFKCVVDMGGCLASTLSKCGLQCVPTTITCALQQLTAAGGTPQHSNVVPINHCYTNGLANCVRTNCDHHNTPRKSSSKLQATTSRPLGPTSSKTAAANRKDGMSLSSNDLPIEECTKKEKECMGRTEVIWNFKCVVGIGECLATNLTTCQLACIPETIQCALNHILSPSKRVQCYRSGLTGCVGRSCDVHNQTTTSTTQD